MDPYVGTEYSSDPEGETEDISTRDPAETAAVRKMAFAEMGGKLSGRMGFGEEEDDRLWWLRHSGRLKRADSSH